MAKKEKLTYLSEESEESGEPVKELKNKLKECQKEKEEYLTQAQRARADLINFRRRQEAALTELSKCGQENFIRELLPVLDSLKVGSEENQGIKQIKEQLENIFKKYGLKEIEALGKKFNPEFHEAVEQVEEKPAKGGSSPKDEQAASGGKEGGTIVEEIQKGYLLADKILRASKVKIAK